MYLCIYVFIHLFIYFQVMDEGTTYVLTTVFIYVFMYLSIYLLIYLLSGDGRGLTIRADDSHARRLGLRCLRYVDSKRTHSIVREHIL